jgi:hypothetical protein
VRGLVALTVVTLTLAGCAGSGGGGGSLATASPKLATTTPAAISARNVVVIGVSLAKP